jgi:hypothetical protein
VRWKSLRRNRPVSATIFIAPSNLQDGWIEKFTICPYAIILATRSNIRPLRIFPVNYESFKAVMHVSPLQYAKSVKLSRAQALIQEGKKAGEAAYLVGYNSPSQFSREYKRHFGYAPSAT